MSVLHLRLFLLLAFLLPGAPVFAITMGDAVQLALQNHQQIEQYRAVLEQRKAEVGEARATFMPRVDLSYAYSKSEQASQFVGKETSTLALGASLNLFNGLTDYREFQAAKERAEAADYQLQAVHADIILATRQAYLEVLRADRSVSTAAEGVILLERQKHDADLQFEYGVIARNDLLRVEVELSSARQDLLRAEGNLRIARHGLERMIGQRLPDDVELSGENLAELSDEDWNQPEVYREQLLNRRSELNYLRHLLSAAGYDQQARRGDFWPDLDLSVVHEDYGDTLTPTGRDDNFDNDNRLLLNASWNLFDGFSTRQRVAAANAVRRSLAAELRDTEATLLLQLETALQNYHIAEGRLEEARTGVLQAEENYRVTENRYQQQQATTVDLLDAQFLLTRARNLRVSAQYDLYLSSARLLRILEYDRL